MFFRSPYADALIVVLVLLLFFGPKRLPALGKSLGQGMREFKDSISGKSKHSDEGEHPELEAATPPPATGVSQQSAPAQAVPSAPQPPQQAAQPSQAAPHPVQPGTQPTQPVPSAPQPPPAAEPAQPAAVSAPSEQPSDQGPDSRA
jgi:sec-independent protein translocase protein TatA